MPPKSKRAAPVAAASATPAPVDPQAASPIHSACARRADARGGLSQTAVREVLREVDFKDLLEHTTRGAQLTSFRDKHLTSVAEKCGVPLLGDLFGRGQRGEQSHALRLEHVLYIVWEQVARAMDDAGAHTIRGEETAVATLARSLVLAAVSAENPAFADTFGEALSVDECVDKIRAIVDMSLGGAPVEDIVAREAVSTVVPTEIPRAERPPPCPYMPPPFTFTSESVHGGLMWGKTVGNYRYFAVVFVFCRCLVYSL